MEGPVCATKDLDRVFEVALVLLGILSAAEFQYASALPYSTSTAQLVSFTFRITTVPFIILILVWVVNELFVKNTHRFKLQYGLIFLLVFMEFESLSIFGYVISVFVSE